MTAPEHTFNKHAAPAPSAQAQAYGQELLNALRKQMPDMDDVMWLVKNGASFDATDARGDTALHLAVRMQLKDIVREMVLRGADVSAANNAGNTAVILAATGGSDVMRSVLLPKPDLAHRNNGGNDALTCAVAAEKSDNMHLLLAAGAQVDAKLIAMAERLERKSLLGDLRAAREEQGRRASMTGRDIIALKPPRIFRPKH
ncbi:MAG: ankyrin repeat domain-containing protein [Alphaproteobacteria bacterium]|nr:ankyrin repeat domain-containing protein [Alphaproteobacteria bacterium]